MKKIVFISVLLCNYVLLHAAELTLVTQGQSNYEIVKTDEVSTINDLAARELQYHIQKATGIELPITFEKTHNVQKKAIYLGATQSAAAHQINEYPKPNGFVIKAIDGNLYITGDDIDGNTGDNDAAKDITKGSMTRYGTLFGVYEFLERSVGVRWLWPGELGEYIPAVSSVKFDGKTISDKPKLMHSRIRYNPTRATGGWSSESNRQKFVLATYRWLLRNRIVRAISLEYGHAYENYFNRFSTTNPDFFNLLPDGKRYSDPMYCGGAPSTISMCVSNPKFQDQVIKDWTKYRIPVQPMVNCAENDTNGKCTCSVCMSLDSHNPSDPFPFENRLERATKAFLAHKPDWDLQLGSLSDRYASFYNAVLKKAQAIDPAAMVLAYSYVNYSKPPQKVKFQDKKIVIGVVPQLIFPWTDSKRQEFRTQWDGWAKAGAQLYLRPNYTLDGHNFPIYYADAFAEDFRYAWNRNMLATDFDSLIGQYATQGLNHYVVARMQLRGGWDKEKIINEYFQAFGPAADAIKKYFAYWKTISDQVDESKYKAKFEEYNFASFSVFYTVASTIFTPEVFKHGFALLAKAEKAASNDPEAAKRVTFLQHGLKNAELTALAQQALVKYKTQGDVMSFARALKNLDEYRASIEGDLGCDFTFLNSVESRLWDRQLTKLLTSMNEPLKSDWVITFDPAQAGEKNGYFKADYPAKDWEPVKVGEFYNKQPVGINWKKTHGNQEFTGVCWYKTNFKMGALEPDKHYRLTFGAVDEACKVYLNGKLLLDRPFPYRGNVDSWQEAFELDITRELLPDQMNNLTVMVINNVGAGGIWKPVFFSSANVEPRLQNGKTIYSNDFSKPLERWYPAINLGEFTHKVLKTGGVGDSGALFLECQKLNADNKSWGRWILENTPVEAGALYQIRLQYKTNDKFVGHVLIWPRPGNGEYDYKGTNTNGAWKEVVINNFKAAENMLHLYINIWDGVGAITIDNVEIIKQASPIAAIKK